MQIQKNTIIRVDFHDLDILKCLILFRFDVFSNNKIQFFQLSSLGNRGTPNVKYLLICQKKKKTKTKDITLLTKVRLVKAMVFPFVMYGCES